MQLRWSWSSVFRQGNRYKQWLIADLKYYIPTSSYSQAALIESVEYEKSVEWISSLIHILLPYLCFVISHLSLFPFHSFDIETTHAQVLSSELLSFSVLLTPLLTAVLLPTQSCAILEICSSFLLAVIHGFLTVTKEITWAVRHWKITRPYLLHRLISYQLKVNFALQNQIRGNETMVRCTCCWETCY